MEKNAIANIEAEKISVSELHGEQIAKYIEECQNRGSSTQLC